MQANRFRFRRHPLPLAAAVMIVAAIIALAPNTASAGHDEQWQSTPTFRGNYVGFAQGTGAFSSCAISTRVRQYTRAIDHAVHHPCHGARPASLVAGRFFAEQFECHEWYVLFRFDPHRHATSWIAVKNLGCDLLILRSDGTRQRLAEGATHCFHITVDRCEHFTYSLDLHIRNGRRHGHFDYQAHSHTDRIVRPQPRPRRPVVVSPRDGRGHGRVVRYVEHRRNRDDDSARRDHRRAPGRSARPDHSRGRSDHRSNRRGPRDYRSR